METVTIFYNTLPQCYLFVILFTYLYMVVISQWVYRDYTGENSVACEFSVDGVSM